MDLDTIRSRFIKESLKRVVLEQDQERAGRALQALRSYFQWFEHRFPDLEKHAIVDQLSKLEAAYSRGFSGSAHGDRVGHHFQETRSLR